MKGGVYRMLTCILASSFEMHMKTTLLAKSKDFNKGEIKNLIKIEIK